MSTLGVEGGPVRDEDLHAYVDGHLDPARRRIVDAYLSTDRDAAARVADWTEQNRRLSALFDPVLDEPIPPQITAAIARGQQQRTPSWGGWAMRAAASFAILAVGAVLGFGTARFVGGNEDAGLQASLPVEAQSAFKVYVAEKRHAVEVPAAEVDHLTQWLSTKMKTKVRPPDLASLGWTLVGGRLLPSSEGPACLFIYDDKAGRRVMVYLVSNANNEGTTVQFRDQNGVRSLYWLEGPLGYALTGNLERGDLMPIAAVVKDKMRF
ncbi:MAG TPA: anti-sigma factor [Vineibacter sp.]|nr:anti-sigma factor [Vineibacter sp.]